MGTTCCCLGTAPVYFCSCWGGLLSLLCLWFESLMLQLVQLLGDGMDFMKLTRCCCLVGCTVWQTVFQVLYSAAGCQTYIHFCPMSQAISSPYLIVNAYRDTTLCSRVLICRRGKGRNLVPSSDMIKIGILLYTCWCLLSFPTLRAAPMMIVDYE